MANNLTGNPWVVTDAAVVTTGPVKILKAEWQEPTAGNDLTILDNSGNTIYDDNAIAGGTGIRLEVKISGLMNGFNVSVIDGGTLYVYVQ
jgi:hypothetical protein